jgi:hypothetical protein
MPARRAGSQSARGLSAFRIRVPPMTAYRTLLGNIPLTGGQVQATVQANGVAQASIGPVGLGTVWYPTQAFVTTTSGIADVSTCTIYLGSVIQANLVGPATFGGFGSIALTVASLTPGALLIAVWQNGHPGDLATVNILGTQSVLTP